jgi:hypothetical protein
MTAAENHNRGSEDGFVATLAPPERLPAAERLENALGEDLTRLLLAALSGAQAPSRVVEPR